MFAKRNGGRVREKLFRLVIASDLHGSTLCLRKLLTAGERYEADAIVVAGDLTGKMIIPIVKDADGYECAYREGVTHLEGAEVPVLKEQLENGGLYPYVTDTEEVEHFREHPDEVERIFRGLMVDRISDWTELIEKRLAGTERELVIIPGNDDYEEIDTVLDRPPAIRMLHERVGVLGEHYGLLGLGFANTTPWHAPRDVPEEVLAERLAGLAGRLDHPERSVFVIHAPPYGTSIDRALEIDENLVPSSSGATMHVGSQAVRDAIEQWQPLLSVHGHVHESGGLVRVGRTKAINPGSEYGQGILRGAIVNLTADSVKSHMFFSG
jgi:Icc-related predicted phosphoesterase